MRDVFVDFAEGWVELEDGDLHGEESEVLEMGILKYSRTMSCAVLDVLRLLMVFVVVPAWLQWWLRLSVQNKSSFFQLCDRIPFSPLSWASNLRLLFALDGRGRCCLRDSKTSVSSGSEDGGPSCPPLLAACLPSQQKVFPPHQLHHRHHDKRVELHVTPDGPAVAFYGSFRASLEPTFHEKSKDRRSENCVSLFKQTRYMK